MEVTCSYDQIASKLLKDNFLLTALELHLELIESGRELSRLKEYFSNPGNFERQAACPGNLATALIARSHSQATLDSLDISRLSEDDAERGAVDERVAVLEFELRRARECISALRANLTEAAATSESDSNAPSSQATSCNEGLKPHEQRALNFLVNEYLLQQGYRLTAVTFSEENGDQDFDDWDDVGLNTARPQELPRLYRDALQRTNKDSSSVDTQTEDSYDMTDTPCQECVQCETLQAELEKQKIAILEVETRLEGMKKQQEIWASEREMTRAAEKWQTDEQGSTWRQETEGTAPRDTGSGSGSSANTDHFEMLDHAPVQEWTEIDKEIEKVEDVKQEERPVPSQFREHLYSLLDIPSARLSIAACRDKDLVALLSTLLPQLLQWLPSQRREEIVPLLALTTRLHPDTTQAALLLTQLLSLRKRPQASERAAIISGVTSLADNLNLLDAHLLPQVWELASMKSMEKRLLAAEICSALAPLTSDLTRTSQLLPLLQQLLLEATEAEVKICVVQNLAVLITYINEADKYLQCEELCIMALKDSLDSVQTCTCQILLPVLAQWATEIGKLQSHLLTRLLSRLQSLATDPRIIQVINALLITLPYLLYSVGNCDVVMKKVDTSLSKPEIAPIFQGLSNPDYFHPGALDIVHAVSLCLNEEWYPMWPELEWVVNTFVPNLYKTLCEVDISKEDIVIAFVKLFHFTCKSFGKNFTSQKIKPLFREGLKNFEDYVTTLNAQEKTASFTSLTIIPVLLVSILTTGDLDDTRELADTLQQLLVCLPICNLPISPLKVSVTLLCRCPGLQSTVIACLAEAGKHSRNTVRLCAAQLTLPCLNSLQSPPPALLSMLSTWANDVDMDVREATVPMFAELTATSSCPQAQIQGRAALQAFLKESPANVGHTMCLALTRALGRVVSSCDPAFREDVVLPHLAMLCSHCQTSQTSQTRRIDVALALVSALSAATQAPLSKQVMATYLVPALRSLEVVTGQCLTVHHDAVSSWLREAESRCNVVSSPATPTSPAERVPVLQSAMSSASAVGRRSVEDVKQKMSSLLRKK